MCLEPLLIHIDCFPTAVPYVIIGRFFCWSLSPAIVLTPVPVDGSSPNPPAYYHEDRDVPYWQLRSRWPSFHRRVYIICSPLNILDHGPLGIYIAPARRPPFVMFIGLFCIHASPRRSCYYVIMLCRCTLEPSLRMWQELDSCLVPSRRLSAQPCTCPFTTTH